MMEQIFDLQSFYDISIIKRENYENPTMTGNNHSNSKELNIYRLIYRDRIYYLQTKMELDKQDIICLLYTSPSPRDKRQSRMPSSA